jgi:DNA-binding MarR family transcriptional regulator
MNDSDAIRQAIRSTAYDEALAEHLGLNATDLRCLELAITTPGLTPSRLAELSGLTTGAVTGVLDRLERAGYIERRPDPVDRRSVGVHVTAGRAAALDEAVGPLAAAVDVLLDAAGPAGRAAVGAFLGGATAAVQAETERLRAESRGGFVGETYRAPAADVDRGRLVFVTGAPRMALNVAPLGPQAAARIIMETSASRLAFSGAAADGDLVEAAFDGPRPDVRVAGGVVTIRYRRKALSAFSSRRARIGLARGIPWSIEIQGGLTDLTGSLTGIVLSRVDVEDGANHVDLDLPVPVGSVGFRIGGLASDVRLRRPRSTAVGLLVDGGVSHLRLDEGRSTQVAGRRRFTTAGYEGSADRYEIEITGGASSIRVASHS